jgi:hypothetical protein
MPFIITTTTSLDIRNPSKVLDIPKFREIEISRKKTENYEDDKNMYE